MITSLLLSLVIGLHLAWVVVVVAGSLAAVTGTLRRTPMFETLYLFVACVTVLNRLVSRECWLTQAELSLRVGMGAPRDGIGFVEHYLGVLGVPLEGGVIFLAGTGLLSVGLLATIYSHSAGVLRVRQSQPEVA